MLQHLGPLVSDYNPCRLTESWETVHLSGLLCQEKERVCVRDRMDRLILHGDGKFGARRASPSVRQRADVHIGGSKSLVPQFPYQ